MTTVTSFTANASVGRRVSGFVQVGQRPTDASVAPILPLPVRLFVEQAKRIIYARLRLDDLPLSIPEVYSRYLEGRWRPP